MTRDPKYVLYPGYVTSINDGDRHYIGVRQLQKLYGLKDSEFVVRWGDERDHGKDFSSLTALVPQRRGKDYDRFRKQIEEERNGT